MSLQDFDCKTFFHTIWKKIELTNFFVQILTDILWSVASLQKSTKKYLNDVFGQYKNLTQCITCWGFQTEIFFNYKFSKNSKGFVCLSVYLYLLYLRGKNLSYK